MVRARHRLRGDTPRGRQGTADLDAAPRHRRSRPRGASRLSGALRGPSAALIAGLLLAPAIAQDERRTDYRLEAGAGLPGAYRVAVPLDQEGAWRFEASWTGRDLAGLWLEDSVGTTIRRVAGGPPLVLDLLVGRGGVEVGTRLLLRFSPMTARGRLEGRLSVIRPRTSEPMAVEPPPAPDELGWPLSCLPNEDDETAETRASRVAAEAWLELNDRERGWMRRWIDNLLEASRKEGSERVRREAFDALWEQLRIDPAPGDAGALYRPMLAAMEDLVRREGSPRLARRYAQRRKAYAAILECLGDEP